MMIIDYNTTRTEYIRCPECGREQYSEVDICWPFNGYVHECVWCGYMILESEWNTVERECV